MLDRLQMVEVHDVFSEEGYCRNHIIPYPKNAKSYLNPTHRTVEKSTVMSAKMFIHMHHPQQQTFSNFSLDLHGHSHHLPFSGETNFVDAYLFIGKYSLRCKYWPRGNIPCGGNVVIEGKYRSCGKHVEGKVHIEAENIYRNSLTKDSFIGNAQ